jgi:hypothetical protein
VSIPIRAGSQSGGIWLNLQQVAVLDDYLAIFLIFHILLGTGKKGRLLLGGDPSRIQLRYITRVLKGELPGQPFGNSFLYTYS